MDTRIFLTMQTGVGGGVCWVSVLDSSVPICPSPSFPDLFGTLPMFFSGKEKAHKHKQIFPVTARVGGGVSRPGGQGSPDRWPGVKSLCAVCGIQGA